MDIGAISLNNALNGFPTLAPTSVITAADPVAAASATAAASNVAQAADAATAQAAELGRNNALLQALQQTIEQFNLTRADTLARTDAANAADTTAQHDTQRVEAAASAHADATAAATSPFDLSAFLSGTGAATAATTTAATTPVTATPAAAATAATVTNAATGTSATPGTTNLTVASTQLTPLQAQAVVALAGALFQAVSPITTAAVPAVPADVAPADAIGAVNAPASSDTGGTAAFQGGYDDTGSHLASLAQQAGSANPSGPDRDTLAALQTNYQNLLATASGADSSIAAYAGAPSLQSFLQTLSQNFTPGFSASPGTNAIGNLLETSV